MSDGTVLNGVYARRIHKSNARDVVETANTDIEYATRMLLIHGASSSPSDGFSMYGDITGFVELIEESCIKRLFAQHIIDSPEECEDELEEFGVDMDKLRSAFVDAHYPCAECGQSGFHKMDCSSKGDQ